MLVQRVREEGGPEASAARPGCPSASGVEARQRGVPRGLGGRQHGVWDLHKRSPTPAAGAESWLCHTLRLEARRALFSKPCFRTHDLNRWTPSAFNSMGRRPTHSHGIRIIVSGLCLVPVVMLSSCMLLMTSLYFLLILTQGYCSIGF